MSSILDWIESIDGKDIFVFAMFRRVTEAMQEQFEPLARVAYAPLYKICDAVGRPPGEVIVVLASLITIMACLPMPWIRNTTARKVYSLTIGLSIGFYTYGVPYFLRIAYIMVAYF